MSKKDDRERDMFHRYTAVLDLLKKAEVVQAARDNMTRFVKERIVKERPTQEPAATRNLAAAMFDAGFRAGADWSGEEHILHDMGSFRYNEERNAAIDAAIREEEK